jgi:hypothetical protein
MAKVILELKAGEYDRTLLPRTWCHIASKMAVNPLEEANSAMNL